MKFKKTFQLDEIINLPNIANEMDDEDLSFISNKVIESYDHDKDSRREWEMITEKALKVIELTHETKHTP